MAESQIPLNYPVSMQPQVVQVYTTTTDSKGQWSSNISDFFDDVGICLCGAFVPCFLACKVASDYGECCCLPVVGGALLAMRTGIRERHHIPGTICNDCVCLTFCGPCTLCQMARELKEKK
ncbi:cornifelin homolog B-like isoform X1 [Pseudophryne corroboree]|uniref:cornifelin homolog B-like isoform X1 n=2 Tax=Pseudophryne corroboree TaxID=495146 RepID=UPI003081AE49